MSDRLHYLVNLLEGDEAIPPASRAWLRQALERITHGADPRVALELPPPGREGRDLTLREHADDLGGTPWSRCRLIAAEAKRIHRGRKTAYAWIHQADQLKKIPETPRQIYNLLK